MRLGRYPLKTPQQLEFMREAGHVVALTHAALRAAVRPGMSTLDLDKIAYDTIVQAGAEPNFLNYQGFPASVCISVNEQIVHGIPSSSMVLRPGDIVSFDCGAVVRRSGQTWHGDAAFTVVLDGGDRAVTERRTELSRMTELAMWAGVASVASANRIGDIGEAIEDAVLGASKEFGWEPGIVEGYTGHGIGNHLHEDPVVYNYRTRSSGPKIGMGTAICVEPMLTDGDPTTAVLADDWTVVTVNGGDAAHWEHTVAITKQGISVLTADDAGAAGLTPFGIVPVSEFAN